MCHYSWQCNNQDTRTSTVIVPETCRSGTQKCRWYVTCYHLISTHMSYVQTQQLCLKHWDWCGKQINQPLQMLWKRKSIPVTGMLESVWWNMLCHLWLYASSVDSLAWVWTNIWRKLQFLCKLWSKFKNATVVFDGYETLKMVDALKTMCITEKVLMYLEQNKWGLQFIKFHEKKTDIFTDVKKQRVVHWQAVPEVKQCRSTQCHTTCNQRCRPFDCTHSSQMFDL